jgi:hypothetical protein
MRDLLNKNKWHIIEIGAALIIIIFALLLPCIFSGKAKYGVDDLNFQIRLLITLIILLTSGIFLIVLYRWLRDIKHKKKEVLGLLIKDLGHTSFVLLTVFAIECLWVFWIQPETIIVSHFFYELFIVIVTFCFISFLHLIRSYQEENVDYADLENDINNTISFSSNTHFYALSLDDYNKFFDETLGFWYFCEQARQIKKGRDDGHCITAKRIIVLDGTTIDNNELCRKAFGKFTQLTHSQINMKNLFLLHKLFDIELYLVPKNIIEEKLKALYTDNSIITISEKNGRIKRNILEKFDRILINNTLWHPIENKKQFKLNRDSDSNKKDNIKLFFENHNMTIPDFILDNFKIDIDTTNGTIKYPIF